MLSNNLICELVDFKDKCPQRMTRKNGGFQATSNTSINTSFGTTAHTQNLSYEKKVEGTGLIWLEEGSRKITLQTPSN